VQAWGRCIETGARKRARLDRVAHDEVVRRSRHAARRGHAVAEHHRHRAVRGVAGLPRDRRQVDVHVHQTRHDGEPASLDPSGAARHRDAGARADRYDAVAADQHRLVAQPVRAGHRQHVDADEGDGLRRLRRGSGRCEQDEGKQQTLQQDHETLRREPGG
jgi:hypothetical protein